MKALQDFLLITQRLDRWINLERLLSFWQQNSSKQNLNYSLSIAIVGYQSFSTSFGERQIFILYNQLIKINNFSPQIVVKSSSAELVYQI